MKQIKNYKEYTIKLLQDVFMGKNGEITSMHAIHNGYTNYSYVVTFENGKKYQVRLPHCGNLINRSNEYQVLSLLGNQDFIYFDIKTGIGVKEWIDGKSPRIPYFWKWKQVDDLFTQIRKIHQTKVPFDVKLKKLNFDLYNQNLFKLKLAYQTKFLSIIETYKGDEMVLSHTDINAPNLILDKNKKLHIIDFEWCALASDYWDYANFIRESRITWYGLIDWNKYIDNFDMNKLKDYIFASSVFAYLWTYMMPQTKKMIKYRRRTLRQVVWYGRGVINNGNKN